METLELRSNVEIDVTYSHLTNEEYLTIKFPLGPNMDLHYFLCKLGTTSMKYYTTINGKLILSIRHELPKEKAVRLMKAYTYNIILDQLQEEYRDDLNDLIEELELIYHNDKSILLEEIEKLHLNDL